MLGYVDCTVCGSKVPLASTSKEEALVEARRHVEDCLMDHGEILTEPLTIERSNPHNRR